MSRSLWDDVRHGLLALGAAAMFGLTIIASEKAPESYVKNMKDTNAETAELRKSIEVKNYDAAAQHAAALKTLFANTLTFWENRKTDDAVGFAKAGVKAAADLETAAKAKNEEAVAASAKALNATCKSCHDAHRARLPDGSSEIK